MSDCEHKEPAKCSNVKWGAIIAGAAIVAGAVLFAPALGLDKIVEGITTALTTSLAKKGGESVITTSLSKAIEAVGNFLVGDTARYLAGASMIGGGAAYFMGGKDESHHEHHHALARANREGHVQAEETRMMQGKMIIQAAHAGNPEAIAMLQQQQQGR